MTGWTLVSLVAILLLGVVALGRRSSRMRQTEGVASVADSPQGSAPETTLRPETSAATTLAPAKDNPPSVVTPDLGSEVLEHLRRIEAKGSPGLAAQVIEIFLQDAATRLKTLREAVARRDGEAAWRVAHTLQGSASMVGALSVARGCAELVQAARSESFDRCEAIVAELDAGVNAIRRVVTG